MALKAVVDDIDTVDEKYRDLYVEKDGRHELAVEDILGHSATKKLRDENGARRISEKKAKDDLGKWGVLGDRKPEDVLAALDTIEELKLAAEGKLDEPKINGIVEKRISGKLAPLQRELEQAKGVIAEKDKTIAGFVSKETQRTVHDSIREAVGKSQGFLPGALEDVLMFADKHFELNEDGKVVTKDGVGVTPGVDPSVWLTEMQPRKAHWWGETKGGGSGGNRNGGGGGGERNPFTAEHWNLTEQGRLVKTNRTRADQMARAAGTTVGGPKPAARK